VDHAHALARSSVRALGRRRGGAAATGPEAEFRVETLSVAQGFELSGPPVHLAFADRLDVRAWSPQPLRNTDDG
jgi:hypothetical protein